jgi:peroxiredoxin
VVVIVEKITKLLRALNTNTAGLALLSAMLLFSSLLLAGCGDPARKLKTGDTPPPFSLTDLYDERSRTFPDDFSGNVVAIRFWADWCPYCDHEMRELEPIYKKFHEQGLVILAVNVHQDSKTADRFIKRLGISYQVLLDLQGKTAADYNVIGLPTTYIIDRQGQISTKIVGESKASLFEQKISELL